MWWLTRPYTPTSTTFTLKNRHLVESQQDFICFLYHKSPTNLMQQIEKLNFFMGLQEMLSVGDQLLIAQNIYTGTNFT